VEPGSRLEAGRVLTRIGYSALRAAEQDGVNYPAHRAGHLKKLDEEDCIPLPPAPHSSPSTGRGILREGFIIRQTTADQRGVRRESFPRHVIYIDMMPEELF
jgi:hypothetical protein